MALQSDDEALLMTYVGPEPERVRRAIVTLAHGQSEELRVLVRAALADFRDVLWWEQQETEGRPAAPIDIERLAGRPQGRLSPPPAEPSAVSVVLLDAGPPTPELTKAIRRVSGRGLADVAALAARVPVTIAEGVERDVAEAIQGDLGALGARVELR